jgi:hypothetical protein
MLGFKEENGKKQCKETELEGRVSGIIVDSSRGECPVNNVRKWIKNRDSMST